MTTSDHKTKTEGKIEKHLSEFSRKVVAKRQQFRRPFKKW